MALRNILTDGDPGLLKKSRPVTDFNKRLHILLGDMRDTLLNVNGLGLAAPQVGVLRRAVLIVDTSIEAEALEEKIIELINPEIISYEGEQTGSEGCLSFPGRYGMVSRPQSVLIAAQDRYGNNFEVHVQDMTARAACHEIDHLNGVLFVSKAERMLTPEEIEEMRNADCDETEDDDAGD